MRLSPAAFDAFLSGPAGTSLAWRRRSACPCTNPSSGSADPLCPLCKGKRHLWAAEIVGKAGVTNQTPQKLQAQFGSWESGDCSLSIPEASPLYMAGPFDRFRALDAKTPFSEVLTPRQVDALVGSIVSISRVFWRAPDHQSLIDGGVPDVSADGTLSWADSSGAPPADTPYTVEGIRFVEWFAFTNRPASRTVGVTGLPLKLGARRLDLLTRFNEAAAPAL